jgi:hypothetical protein
MKKFICAMVVCVLLGCPAAFASQEADSLKRLFLKGDYGACSSEGLRLTGSRRDSDSEELYYITGLSCLKAGEYDSAGKMFAALLKNFRRSRFADEARVGIADSVFLKGDMRGARAKYEDFLRMRGSSKMCPGVYYRLALLGNKTGDRSLAQMYRDKLRKEFPRSPEAGMEKDIFPEVRMASEDMPIVLDQSISVLPKAGRGFYAIQVGAFSKEQNAGKLKQQLVSKGYPAYVQRVASYGSVISFKVKVGQFDTISEAKALERKLIRSGYSTRLDKQ